jgi:hypothetical protein
VAEPRIIFCWEFNIFHFASPLFVTNATNTVTGSRGQEMTTPLVSLAVVAGGDSKYSVSVLI